QNTTTLRTRATERGEAEPIIQQQGSDRVVVQLPGVQDTARAKDILGRTATLEIRMVNDAAGRTETAPGGSGGPTTVRVNRNGRAAAPCRSAPTCSPTGTASRCSSDARSC